MAVSALLRAKRGSFSNYNATLNKDLRLIHDIIDEQDIEGQHDLAMLMLDGLVHTDYNITFLHCCDQSFFLSGHGLRERCYGVEI